MAPETARQQWQQLQDALAALCQGQLTVAQWSARTQAAQALRSALPERFDAVLMELLNRLESSALFSEESCSFSQGELLQSLQMWLDKAAAQLDRTEP